ncbi:hypothetical protein ACJ72_04137 [Emergomyces africanus]|uniref:Uncharacterized protein n=1 Tax=Emergomyces africanus TaxID=1955775 RepID=A0A1B7NXN2_9EURO|nr:hypothetical protein ACJ72_04137 [Emergomyces africanus]
MSGQEIPEFSDDETDSDINDCKSESFTGRGADVSSDYNRTPSLSVTQSPPPMSSPSSPSALHGHAEHALESHLPPEPRKSLELQEDGCASVVISCAKHSSDQKLNIWHKPCSNSECTQQHNEPVWDYEQLSGFRIENGKKYIRVN